MSFQIPIVHLPRSITFASYIAFSASKGYLTLTVCIRGVVRGPGWLCLIWYIRGSECYQRNLWQCNFKLVPSPARAPYLTICWPFAVAHDELMTPRSRRAGRGASPHRPIATKVRVRCRTQMWPIFDRQSATSGPGGMAADDGRPGSSGSADGS